VTVEIPLTQGFVAVVDDEDAPRVLAAGKWHVVHGKRTHYGAKTYNLGGGKYQTVYLHTFLTDWPRVDHRNGDGLDNRRTNLRQATNVQNGANSRRRIDSKSGYKGVSWHTAGKAWCARITVERQTTYLGLFTDPRDAALAYDEAARELHGPFARPNFPEENAS
jgi:AP2 domain